MYIHLRRGVPRGTHERDKSIRVIASKYVQSFSFIAGNIRGAIFAGMIIDSAFKFRKRERDCYNADAVMRTPGWSLSGAISPRNGNSTSSPPVRISHSHGTV